MSLSHLFSTLDYASSKLHLKALDFNKCLTFVWPFHFNESSIKLYLIPRDTCDAFLFRTVICQRCRQQTTVQYAALLRARPKLARREVKKGHPSRKQSRCSTFQRIVCFFHAERSDATLFLRRWPFLPF